MPEFLGQHRALATLKHTQGNRDLPDLPDLRDLFQTGYRRCHH